MGILPNVYQIIEYAFTVITRNLGQTSDTIYVHIIDPHNDQLPR